MSACLSCLSAEEVVLPSNGGLMSYGFGHIINNMGMDE
jgi:hypothetical protein